MFERAACPEELGISSAGLLAYLDALTEKGLELHGVVVLRHGKIAWSADFAPYDTHSPHMLFSLSKSFCSTAVGFAVAEGYFALTDTLISFFPEYAPADASDNMKRMTVHDLLCMGGGFSEKSDVRIGEDWTQVMFQQEVPYEPGTHFHYNSMSTYLCSAIVQKKTGQTVRDYLMPRLFTPLGIAKPEWDSCPMGVSCGGWGLHLSTLDIARFGQLLLQNGVWEGQQLLPSGWVEMATGKQIDNFVGDALHEWQQGYGYQFWRCRNNQYRGDGMNGQACWVISERDVVVAITAGLQDMGKEFECLREVLVPAIDAPCDDPTAKERLAARTASLAYTIPQGEIPDDVPVGGQYVNEEGNKLILLRTSEGLHIDNKNTVMHISCTFGIGEYHPGSVDIDVFQIGTCQTVAACGWDAAAGTLRLVLRLIAAPFTLHATMVWTEDGLTVTQTGPGFPNATTAFRRV